MGDSGGTGRPRLWPYSILAPVVFNIGALVAAGGLFLVDFLRADGVGVLQPDFEELQFAISVMVFLLEWVFAGMLIRGYRRSSSSLRGLMAPQTSRDEPDTFNWQSALAMTLAFNAVFAIYIIMLRLGRPDLSYVDMPRWQKGFMLVLTPLTAAFTEELIWRGHLIHGWTDRGKPVWQAVVLSALSFSMIHGVFLPARLVVTFLIGLITGAYYARERRLLPLMAAHWLVDVWSFALFLFLA
ncbi:MAG: CPBP family intramembrane glutamic endopeptidase [Anaerolineae bacterium]